MTDFPNMTDHRRMADILRERLEDCGCQSTAGDVPCGGCEHDAMCLASIDALIRCAEDAEKANTDLRWRLCKVLSDSRDCDADDIAKEKGWDDLVG